jgi:putative nucleotidyltransferase with HDIG domain
MDVNSKTALMSNLVFLVDRVDALTAQYLAKKTDISLLSLSNIIHAELEELSGSFFDPKLVKAFLRASKKETFWLTLEQDNLHRYLDKYILSLEREEIDLVSLLHISKVFANIIDAKSPYTAYHSLDVGMLSHFIATKMKLESEICTKIEIAGLLHDLGKLHIPDELLNKKSPLTDDESDVIKTHVYATYKILSKIKGMEEITQWALQHHEKLNGTGYPNHCEQKTISLPARIVAVADIFQALAQRRPYRTNLEPLKILELIQGKVIAGEIDSDVVAIVEKYLQQCWEISLFHSYRLSIDV